MVHDHDGHVERVPEGERLQELVQLLLPDDGSFHDVARRVPRNLDVLRRACLDELIRIYCAGKGVLQRVERDGQRAAGVSFRRKLPHHGVDVLRAELLDGFCADDRDDAFDARCVTNQRFLAHFCRLPFQPVGEEFLQRDLFAGDGNIPAQIACKRLGACCHCFLLCGESSFLYSFPLSYGGGFRLEGIVPCFPALAGV